MKKKLVSMLLLCGLLMTPALTAAQPAVTDQVFPSVVAGIDVDLGTSGDVVFIPENYELSETPSFQEEYIWFTYNWSNFQLVFIAGPNETAEYHDITLANMYAFYESFEIVDEEITDDHSWFLANAVVDGSPLVVYYEFQLDAIGELDLLLMQFSDETTLASDLEFVQGEVTLGGEPLLPETDAQALSEMLGIEPDTTTETTGSTRTTRTSTSGNTSETSGVTEIATPDATGTNRASRTGRLGNSSPASTPETVTDAADWPALGLASDTEWVSPLRGTSISWDAAMWEFPRDYEYAIVIDEPAAYEMVTLQTNDGNGYVFLSLEDTGDATPRSLVSYWNSPEYAEGFTQDITVLETASTATTASVVYETTNTRDQQLISIIEATFLDDGTIAFSQISAAPETIQDVYGQFEQGVQINGAPISLSWTVEDIADIVGN